MPDAALSFDIESNVSNFSRAMQLVESTAKQKAAAFALEFTGAGKRMEDAFGGFAKRGGVQIGDSLSSAAKRYEADFAKATQNVGLNLTKGIGDALKPGAISVGALAASVATVAVGFVTVAAAIDQANKQIDRFIKLGDNSERAGIGVEFFQRFSEAATKAKLDVADVETALKRAGSLVTPKFDQEDPIKARLNQVIESGYVGSYQSKGLADYNAAGTNEQRIRAAVTAMQELRDLGLQTAAIEIGEKLFGPEVADRIRSGRLDIDAIAASLDKPRADLVSQQQVEQAREFRERLDEAYHTIDNALHVSVALEGAGRGILDIWLKIAEATAAAATSAGGYLDKMIAAAKAARDAQPPSALQSPLTSRTAQEGEGNLAADMGAVAGRSARGKSLYAEPIGPQQPTMTITDPPAPPRRPLDWYTDPTSYGRGTKPKAASTPSETLDQVQTAINGIERSTEALKAEADAIGKSATERQSAINVARIEAIARQQGITLTEEQIAKVKSLSKATVEYRDAIDDARERQEALRSIGGDVLRGIADDARGGASALDILTSAVGRLATRLQDKALDSLADSLFGKRGGADGTGLLGGLLGGGGGIGEGIKGLNLASLFGASPLPTFAAGVTAAGVIQGPGTGTSDSILARVSKGESIITAEATRRHRPLIEAINANRLPAFAEGRIGDAIASVSMPAVAQMRMDMAQASAAGAAASSGPPVVNIHNNGPPVQAQAEQRPDGSMDIFLDQLEGRLAGRIASGRGPLSSVVPNGRKLRG